MTFSRSIKKISKIQLRFRTLITFAHFMYYMKEEIMKKDLMLVHRELASRQASLRRQMGIIKSLAYIRPTIDRKTAGHDRSKADKVKVEFFNSKLNRSPLVSDHLIYSSG